MQNPDTGMLEAITQEQFDKLNNLKPGEETGMTFKDGKSVRSDVATFRVGQVVELNGGKFRVRKITKKDLVLRGIKS